jgi:folate-binding protein YgfZ
MGPTALQIHNEALGAVRSSEYRGATTAASFGNPQAEWTELRAGCGVYDLGFRAKISLTGGDRVRWLNGMVTNNIRDLAAGGGAYAFLLNPQGHILGDVYAYNLGESGALGSIMLGSNMLGSIMVDTDRDQVEKILATFDHYIIMDDVEVTDLSEKMTALGVAGPKARAVLQVIGMEFPELQPLQFHTVQCNCECACLTCTIVRTDDPLIESYEIWLSPEHVKPLWDALVKAGARPVGAETLELQRIVAGVPRYGVDIRERDLPQETEQQRALNFNKGCYIGQEIVERIRSRGAVHRKFSGFVIDEAVQIPAGAKIIVGEKEVGEITGAASLQVADAHWTVALGYIRREAGVPGREVSIGTTKANVAQLPIDLEALSPIEKTLEQHRA